MPQALISLNENSNHILNMVKAKYNLKDKSEAIELVIEQYIECVGEPDFKDEFIERICHAEKGRFVKVANFAKRYGG